MGWLPAGDGLFRWVAPDGEPMVESLWWVDGSLEQHPASRSEAGEGWLVVAKPTAWERIAAAGQHWSEVVRVGRGRGTEFVQSATVTRPFTEAQAG